jgi:hypothetical protein
MDEAFSDGFDPAILGLEPDTRNFYAEMDSAHDWTLLVFVVGMFLFIMAVLAAAVVF